MWEKVKSKFDQLGELATIALVLGVVVALNYFLSLFPLRWDVTSNQRYSLSPASRQLVRQTDDLVKIKAFISQKLPPQYSPEAQQVKDLLWEYERAGGGNVRVEYLEPSANNDLGQEAQSLGIFPVQFSDISQEKFEVSQGYFGLAILYAGKHETISFIGDTGNLEYQISLAISNLTRESKPKLAFISGHGEKSIQTDLQQVAEALRSQYSVSEITLEDLHGSMDDYQAAAIVGPETQFSDQDKYYLDQFLMKDKGVLLLLETVKIREGLTTEPTKHGLDSFLEDYGIKLNNNLVLDAYNEIASFTDGQNPYYVRYPFWVKVRPQGFSGESVITNRLENAVFPWVSSVEALSQLRGGVTARPLIQSSSQSWTMEESFNLSPQQTVTGETAVHTLGVLLEGKLGSYFANRETAKDLKTDNFDNEAEQARLIIVGDANFAEDRFVTGNAYNFTLLANTIDYLSAETGLTSIRAKGQVFRPIQNFSSRNKMIIKYLNMLGPAVLLLALGFYYGYRRRHLAD